MSDNSESKGLGWAEKDSISLSFSLHIDEGQPHWYPEVFESEQVRSFLEEALSSEVQLRGPTSNVSEFTLTVADPVRSGSKNGWKIDQLLIPGRYPHLLLELHRYSVHTGDHLIDLHDCIFASLTVSLL